MSNFVRMLPKVGDEMSITVSVGKESYSSAVVRLIDGPTEVENVFFGNLENSLVFKAKVKRSYRWSNKKTVFVRLRPMAIDEKNPDGTPNGHQIVGYIVHAN